MRSEDGNERTIKSLGHCSNSTGCWCLGRFVYWVVVGIIVLTFSVQFCTLMYMKLTEFRKNISKELDRALAGERVTIERGGIVFKVIPIIRIKKSKGGPM